MNAVHAEHGGDGEGVLLTQQCTFPHATRTGAVTGLRATHATVAGRKHDRNAAGTHLLELSVNTSSVAEVDSGLVVTVGYRDSLGGSVARRGANSGQELQERLVSGVVRLLASGAPERSGHVGSNAHDLCTPKSTHQ